MKLASEGVRALNGREIVVHQATARTLSGPERESTILAPETWQVHRYRLLERLGEPGTLAIHLVTPNLDLDIDGLAAADFGLVTLHADRERSFQGVVVRAEYVGTHALHLHLKLIVQPALALARQQTRSRIFQERTVVEIVEEVLAPLFERRNRGLDTARITRKLAERDYCVQFRETDLAFVTRILAEEGITYAFDHDDVEGRAETMVLLDSNSAMVPVGDEFADSDEASGPTEIRVLPTVGNAGAFVEGIDGFGWQRELEANFVEYIDSDWRSAPLAQHRSERRAPTPEPWQQAHLFAHQDLRVQELGATDDRAGELLLDTKFHAQRMHQHNVSRSKHARGHGQVLRLQPGRTLAVQEHPFHDLNAEYLVTESEAVAFEPSADPTTDRSTGGTWETGFRCIPLETTYRPTVLAKPLSAGPVTAQVVGPKADDIHTDEFGRIRVVFHWDRESRTRAGDHRSSCWLRVAQSWAGPGYGMQFIPRVGMEVIVSFINGDPDRPVCTGCVYSAQNPPPYPPPEDKTKSGIKTQSSPHGDGYNELRFDDALNKEEIFLHAQRNLRQRVRASESTSIGANRSLSVGKDWSATVGGSRTVATEVGETIHVGATPDGAPAAPPQAGVASLIAESKRTVSAVDQATYTVGKTSPSTLDLTPTQITLSASKKIVLKVGDSSIEIDAGQIVIKAKNVSLKSENSDILMWHGGILAESTKALQLKRTDAGSVSLFDEIVNITASTVSAGGKMGKLLLNEQAALLAPTVKVGSAAKAEALGGQALVIDAFEANLKAGKIGIAATSGTNIVGKPVHLNPPGG